MAWLILGHILIFNQSQPLIGHSPFHIEMERIRILQVSMVQSFQQTVPRGFNFPSNKLKLIFSITFHSNVYEDSHWKLKGDIKLC